TPHHAKYYAHDLTRQAASGMDYLSMALFDASEDLAVASSTPRARRSGSWWKCWSSAPDASMPPAAAQEACSCNRKNSWKSTTAASSTSPATGQESNYPSAAVQDEPSGARHQRRHPLEQKVAFRGPS